jgi:phenylacetate-CoA ligase
MNAVQRIKLRRLLIDAWRNVPMYRALYEAAGLSERHLSMPDVLGRLPILTKAQLLATPQEKRVNGRFGRSRLTMESTTGSTGQPFSLYIDSRYRLLRNLRFLFALSSAGYRPWHRMLLLTDRHAGFVRRQNRYYQSVEQPSADILEAYLRVRPHVLYGFTTPLRLLAESIRGSRRSVPRPRLVVSTAEMLDSATREALAGAFDCPVIDFYGLTEMGLVAWQRRDASEYILATSSVLTELVPDSSSPDRYRLLLTNLDLRGSPIIRFDSGDLAHADLAGGKLRIRKFEGRIVDTLLARDGKELSPYRVTDALRDITGIKRFRISQRTLSELDIYLETEPGARNKAVEEVQAVFDSLLGAGLELNFTFSENLIADGARKFRPIESRVPRL